jgi:hypothetical protein
VQLKSATTYGTELNPSVDFLRYTRRNVGLHVRWQHGEEASSSEKREVLQKKLKSEDACRRM